MIGCQRRVKPYFPSKRAWQMIIKEAGHLRSEGGGNVPPRQRRCALPGGNGENRELPSARRQSAGQHAPWAIMASATLRKPAMLAPTTRLPGASNSLAVSEAIE